MCNANFGNEVSTKYGIHLINFSIHENLEFADAQMDATSMNYPSILNVSKLNHRVSQNQVANPNQLVNHIADMMRHQVNQNRKGSQKVTQITSMSMCKVNLSRKHPVNRSQNRTAATIMQQVNPMKDQNRQVDIVQLKL